MDCYKAEIELVNPDDLVLVDHSKIKRDEVRKLKMTALVDPSSYYLCSNETIRSHLGLRHMTYQKAELADGRIADVEMVGPVILNFKNRTTASSALELPGNSEPLLGSIPMEGLDVVLVPLKQTIDVHPEHPLVAQTLLK